KRKIHGEHVRGAVLLLDQPGAADVSRIVRLKQDDPSWLGVAWIVHGAAEGERTHRSINPEPSPVVGAIRVAAARNRYSGQRRGRGAVHLQDTPENPAGVVGVDCRAEGAGDRNHPATALEATEHKHVVAYESLIAGQGDGDPASARF